MNQGFNSFRILSIVLALFFGTGLSYGQQLPLYTQYVYDPYLINPSMVGFNKTPEVNVLYRRQWSQIQDGPRTVQFDGQLPLGKRMAVGINVYDDKSVLLSASSALVTYGYQIPLATDHSLGFGLSAGVLMNRINLNDVAAADANDPALLSTATNNTTMNGQFGMHYSYKALVLGFSFTNLFQHSVFTPEKFQSVKFSALENRIYMASYRFKIADDHWAMKTNFSYRQSQNYPNFYETSLLVSYQNKVDLGAGYRQNFGPSVIVRVRWAQLQVGMAYDLPAANALVSTGGTQEFQLAYRFGPSGTKKESTKTTPIKEEVYPQVQPLKKPIDQEPVKAAEKESNPLKEQPVEVPQDAPKESPKQDADPAEGSFYLLVGAFKILDNAESLVARLTESGIKAEIKESERGEPHFFYVHLTQYKSSNDIAPETVLKLRETTEFKDAWVKKMR